MALVCYGSSGESSDEECEVDSSTDVNVEVVRHNINNINPSDRSDEVHPKKIDQKTKKEVVQENGTNLEASRPHPEPPTSSKFLKKKKSARDKIKAELLKNIPFPKRKDSKEPVLIMIPSLDDFEEEDSADTAPKQKRLKSSQSCELFSMLPPPKNSTLGSKELNRALIPHSVSKTKSISSSSKSLSQKTIEKYTKSKTTSLEEDDSVESNNFFSLSEEKDVPTIQNVSAPATSFGSNASYIPIKTEMYSSPQAKVTPNFNQYEHELSSYSDSSQCYTPQSDCSNVDPSQISAENNIEPANALEDPMQDEKFLKMIGKRKGEKIEFIDIHAADQLPKPGEWQTKSLTEEQPVSSRKNPNQPNSQQRRKHQITYLAFQAKQRELELKNTWAQNRMTRKQTQAKYGF